MSCHNSNIVSCSMTCQHCCGAEGVFDNKAAEKDYKRYQRKGPNKTTLSILNAIQDSDVQDATLLDIGGGVGVLQHELLKRGAKATTNVDASFSYQEKARELGKTNGTSQQMSFYHGDFVDHEKAIDQHDIVTLERVVCCYPDVQELITTTTNKSKRIYALVYPLDNFLSRLLIKVTHVYFWFKKNPFRTFVHSEKMMHELIEAQGFELVKRDRKSFWRIAVYRRK